MLHRRNASDAAVGWISTVDSLLLGFGLMLILALHSAMTRGDQKAAAERIAKQLEAERLVSAGLENEKIQWQSRLHEEKALQANSLDSIATLHADMQSLREERDELEKHTARLQEQLDAGVQGIEGINKTLKEALRERDLFKQQQAAEEERVLVLRDEIEEMKKKLADATKAATGNHEENEALKATMNEMQAQLLVLKDRQDDASVHSENLQQEANRLRAEGAKRQNLLQGKLNDAAKELGRVQRSLRESESARIAAEEQVQKEASARGQAAATDVLGFKGRFENVVFIIDISHSMTHVKDPERSGYKNAKFRPERWDRVKKEIITWASNLRMKSLRVVLFHSDVMEYPGNGGFYGMEGEDRAASVAALTALLEKEKPNLATNTLGAFEAAYTYPNVDTMILFTDGRPLVGGRKVDDVIADVQKLVRKHANIPVNVVGIGEYFEKSFADFLRDIAEATGGEFIGR
jgi:hypothetical protein